MILESLADEYDGKSKLAFSMYPSDYTHPLSNAIVEPYNAVLHLSQLIKYADVSFTIENPQVYRLCKERLGVEKPSYTNLNHMIAQVISSLTLSLRRFSDFNVDINEYATNLVPFQKRHFMLTSFSPLRSIDQEPTPVSVAQMTQEAF